MLRLVAGVPKSSTRYGLSKMKKQFLFTVCILFFSCWALADRVKDLTSVAGVRSNQLVGYGLVVGLSGTGDRDKISFTAQSLKTVLDRLGVDVDLSLIHI